MVRTGTLGAAWLLVGVAFLAMVQPPPGMLEAHQLASTPSAPSLPGTPAAPGGVPSAGSVPPPAGALPSGAAPVGAPVSEAPGAPAPLSSVPLSALTTGSPYDALLAATGSASGMALAPAMPPADASASGSPSGAAGASERLSTGGLNLADLQRILLETSGVAGVKSARLTYTKVLGPDSLEQAVAAVYAALGMEFSASQRADVHDAAANLDPRVRDGAALVLFATADAQRLMADSVGKLDASDANILFACLSPGATTCADPAVAAKIATDELDRAAFARAGLMVLSALEQAMPLFQQAQREMLSQSAMTLPNPFETTPPEEGDEPQSFRDPMRLIQIGGTGSDLYEGNLMGGSINPAQQVFTLDLGGNDRYLNTAGGASVEPIMMRAGLGDLAPHQVPVSASYGSLVSVSIDLVGDDAYSNVYGAQGSGRLGLGLLLDIAGNDQYMATSESQGYGSTGVGLLIDVTGNDRFSCQWDCQAHGRVGGVGVLVEGAGGDQFSAASWSQGVGVNQGTGFLVDLAGDDTYTGGVVTQGATDRVGVGVFADAGGNDRYAMQGPGRGAISGSSPYNVGVALFSDLSGTEVYSGGSCGCGNSVTWTAGTYGKGQDS